MLYHETEAGFVEWKYDVPVNGILHPRDIETNTAWDAAKREAVGLYTPVDPGVPEGKRVVSTTVARVGGVVQFVYQLEDVPPLGPTDVSLTMRQLRLGLLLIGGFPADFIQATIAAIPDATERAVAQIWYDETSVVEWAHPMTQSLIAAAGISEAQASAMWMQAKDLAA